MSRVYSKCDNSHGLFVRLSTVNGPLIACRNDLPGLLVLRICKRTRIAIVVKKSPKHLIIEKKTNRPTFFLPEADFICLRIILLADRTAARSKIQGGPIKTVHFWRYHIFAATTDIIMRFLLKCSEITGENNKQQFKI